MSDELLGLSLSPGDAHYRAYVGPPQDYDLVSGMTFSLLVACGLRQNHKLLDIGCGSLRLGRLLIPYLNPRNYVGLEPNKWLVEDGIRYEVGQSLSDVRHPTFIYDTNLDSLSADTRFDYVVAQSIFSHTGIDLLSRWVTEVSSCLAPSGVMLATIITSDADCLEQGWIYPECVAYRLETIAEIAAKESLTMKVLDWYHPRQTWCAFYLPDFEQDLLNDGEPSWNNLGVLLRSRMA